MKRYTYFISGMFDGSVGNGEAWSEGGPITTLAHIREIEKHVAAKTGRQQVILTNYILMRVERIS